MRLTFRALVAPCLVAAAAGSLPAQSAAPLRIAYVNPQALFQSAPGRAEAQAAYQRETDGYRAELTKMSSALTQMVSDYQKNEASLLPAEKEKRQQAIQAKEDSLRTRQEELEEQAAARQSELMAPIMETVRKVLEDIRAEDGYSFILSSEPGSSPILAADKNLDITDRVVARLRTVGAAKPPAKPAGAPAAVPSGVTRPRPPGA
jgi:outer membrane protein